jgi:hypothetical protein
MAVTRVSSIDNTLYYGSIWREIFTVGAADVNITCAHPIEGCMLDVRERSTGCMLFEGLDYTISTDGTNKIILSGALGFEATIIVQNVE